MKKEYKIFGRVNISPYIYYVIMREIKTKVMKEDFTYDEILDLIEEQEQKYKRNKLSFLLHMNTQLNQSRPSTKYNKVKSIVFDDGLDCPTWERLSDNIETIKKFVSNKTDNTVEVTMTPIFTQVNNKMVYRPRIVLTSNDGSHIGFAPEGSKIDISRVYVLPNSQGRGLGSFLMKLALEIVSMFDTDNETRLVLSCLGSVGQNDSLQETPINKQVGFFKKFGFAVSDRVCDGGRLIEVKMTK